MSPCIDLDLNILIDPPIKRRPGPSLAFAHLELGKAQIASLSSLGPVLGCSPASTPQRGEDGSTCHVCTSRGAPSHPAQPLLAPVGPDGAVAWHV